jgi:hypothetical protein
MTREFFPPLSSALLAGVKRRVGDDATRHSMEHEELFTKIKTRHQTRLCLDNDFFCHASYCNCGMIIFHYFYCLFPPSTFHTQSQFKCLLFFSYFSSLIGKKISLLEFIFHKLTKQKKCHKKVFA